MKKFGYKKSLSHRIPSLPIIYLLGYWPQKNHCFFFSITMTVICMSISKLKILLSCSFTAVWNPFQINKCNWKKHTHFIRNKWFESGRMWFENYLGPMKCTTQIIGKLTNNHWNWQTDKCKIIFDDTWYFLLNKI